MEEKRDSNDRTERIIDETTTGPVETTSNKQHTTFTKRQKWIIVSLASVAATFSGFAGNIYFPALPAIVSDFDVSVALVNLTVTSYMIFQGLAPPIWGAIADVKGRRIAYMCTFIVLICACVGLAETPNYATLLILRCVQSTGSASTIAIGSGVIGDITTRDERGGYMGIFQAGLLVPLAAGPIIGGALADGLGWRSIFWFLAIYSALFLLVLALALPETLRSIVGNGSKVPDACIHRQPLAWYQRYQPSLKVQSDDDISEKKHIDLVGALRVLFNRRAVLVVAFLTIYYAVWQMTITVMSILFESIYHLNETEIGLTFIANGLGSIIGTTITGKLLDMEYRRVKADLTVDSETQQAESDFPIERARLRLIPTMALVQCASILVYGWTLHYHIHIAVPIITTFVSAWMAVSIQSAIATYLVDIFPEKSASASAALNLARCLVGAGGTAAVYPLIDAVGIGLCFTILTGIMLLALGFIVMHTWFKRRAKSTRG